MQSQKEVLKLQGCADLSGLSFNPNKSYNPGHREPNMLLSRKTQALPLSPSGEKDLVISKEPLQDTIPNV